MKLLRHTVPAGIGVAAVSLAMAALPQDALAQWEPQRPIEFVIQTSPGGGSDTYARLWIGIVEKLGISPVPITPVNMPGGAGAVALAHLRAQSGDPHYITPTLNSVVTTPLQQEIPVMYPSEDLTPIALVTIDPFLLWVHPDRFSSWEEFHEACQNERLTAIGTGARQEDEIQMALLQEASGCQPFRYVPAAGGGDVASGVAGQNADFNFNQPAEALPHYPERLIPIVAFAQERFEAFPEAPTHWELEIGTDSEYAELLDMETGLHQMRGIVAPPDIPQEAIEWYENLFRQVYESEDWQNFIRETAQEPIFMGAAEYKEWLTTFEDNHVRMMQEVFGWDLRSDLRVR
jgi:putative tricarboxylic transport membrane protein